MLAGTPPTTVTFAANAATAELTVATEDDEVDESASIVTAALATGGGYSMDSGAASATVTVEDDDAAPTGLPAISGTPQVGGTLTASSSEISDADGLTNATFAWQWIANDGTSDAEIAGATASTYALTSAELGKTIKVRVRFTDDGGTEETLVSAATAAVGAANAAPTGLPTISGIARVQYTLRGSNLQIRDADGIDYHMLAWQWIANDGTSDTDIAGATAREYTLTSAELGKTIKVRVRFTDHGGTEETLVSAATAAVGPTNAAPTGLPTISGTPARVQYTLRGSFSEIRDANGIDYLTLAWQWIVNDGTSDTDIAGATAREYRLTAADVGKTIKVRVTFTDDGGTEETLVSEPTLAVISVATPHAKITGSPGGWRESGGYT